MTDAIRAIPLTARLILGLHLAWGLFLLFGYSALGDAARGAQPLFVAAWFGTTAMFLVFGLVVATEGWRPNEVRYLACLLTFDLAALVLAADQVLPTH